MATLPGVADVRYDRAWLATVGTGLDVAAARRRVLALMMALAASVTVAAVVRLGLHARREEIEIMQLVGASHGLHPRAVRGRGRCSRAASGAIGAVLLLWGGFAAASASWGPQLTAALEGVDPQFLPAAVLRAARSRGHGRWAGRAALRPPGMRSERPPPRQGRRGDLATGITALTRPCCRG